MGWSDFIRKFNVPNVTIVNQESEYATEKVGTIQIPDKLDDTNAFTLAHTVAEIYHPIDFLADRASKLNFHLVNSNGEIDETTSLNRFLTTPNPLYSFSDLVYQAVFSYLSTGNLFIYQGFPTSYKKASVNSISRVDVLNPEQIFIQEFRNISKLDVNSLNDYISEVKYCEGKKDKNLDKERLLIFNYDTTNVLLSNVFCKSPLFKAFRSINNLLATYSARYNVYVNNGAAGYLAKKQTANTIDENINPITREEILKDINERNGITGNRHLYGISSVPLDWINTLVSIKDLLPFEETLEDSIKIAAIFQIPANLVARKDMSTYDNQLEAERAVWENALMSIVNTIADCFTKAFALDKAGYSIQADYSTVSCLQENEKAKEEVLTLKIANYEKLYQSGKITLNQYLEGIGQPTQEGGDKFIYDLTKTPYASKYGAIIMETMISLLTDPNLTPEQKTNTLIVIYGLSEEEAKQIINTNGNK